MRKEYFLARTERIKSVQDLKAAFAAVRQLSSYDRGLGVIDGEHDLPRSRAARLLAALDPRPLRRIFKR